MKIFLVVLLLLAVLFAVGVILGAARTDAPDRDPEREPKPFETSLGSLAGSLKPKASLAAKEFAGGTSTSVPPADEAMRMLKLRIAKGCRIDILYERGPHKDPSKLDRQPWPPEKGELKNKESTTFVILKEGGTITFGRCGGTQHAGCKVFVVED
jgi:hypothetical protein